MPQCGCVEHGLEYFSFYVQKHIAHLAACSGLPTGSQWTAKGALFLKLAYYAYFLKYTTV